MQDASKQDATKQPAPDPVQARKRGRWKLFAVLLVCAAPMILSYLTYYVIKPSGRTNYGALIDPRTRPIPAMASTTLDGRPETLQAYAGKWIMLKVGGGECLEACQKQLFAMRQWRLMQGKNMDRVERVWLVTDDQPLDTMTIRQYDGMHLLRAPGDVVAKWLPAEGGTQPSDHIYLIDPLGNLMMRFPADPDPRKVYKDIAKLLKASAIG
ncbi:cytochrome C oxidase subunit I [Massilia sp. G4R7]|uniref:Cytochrome C oxidase subunit I n=1 Tax=Massilia phyllostachyos TaxID=2898585 RepID=A0ABS8QAP7_9BURK|nr:cytochrome C oxidase subunit I [Massilia phyllostachyos]MCD2518122.1 cytochrome C oxidase subunit I [Massilia phyllostachyos]